LLVFTKVMSGGANRKPLFSGLPLVGLTALLF